MRGLILDFGGVLAGPGSDMDGLSSVLAGARTRGVRTAILSNDPGGPGAQWLRELGDGRLVDQVVLSGDVGVAKPDPRIYRLTAESLGLDPGDCIFVDDLPVNVRGAVAVGMVGIHHVDGAATADEIAILLEVDRDGMQGEQAPTW
ncbi:MULTISPECIES: HAD-IA family hydrolase [unclassified Rhodococcus (in: high G+C Gram-positive bacteria)]|uniref:HAD-IA family hydrolase n=1 Tax=unclassified Rhodococcus (in: high G+C Gram-positive bacteria) TaxID=192944 RepID=UPI000B3BF341|nr:MULTISPECIES: HAD-IA family hydrolase [unclassified Rhodococcus (in: high G+C Gram-positive bacteria)]KAF0962974.1 Phosphoglycolate phosphatase [Rhodococcus sp. T7]OUS96240.1 HAD family hydrolase [Rhodococcus sp. NCIMB 12038]